MNAGGRRCRAYLEMVVLGENQGFLSWVIRGFLLPLSLIYRAGLAVYLWTYALGLRKQMQAECAGCERRQPDIRWDAARPPLSRLCAGMLAERG